MLIGCSPISKPPFHYGFEKGEASVGHEMKTKYPNSMWLVYGFYVLIAVVGGAQLLWAALFGPDFSAPALVGFYMLYRLTLSVLIILLFGFRRRASLFWVIVIECSVNIFVVLYFIYEALWYICRSENFADFRCAVECFGIHTGWNALLGLISSVILGHMVVTWRQLIPQQPDAEVQSEGAPSD